MPVHRPWFAAKAYGFGSSLPIAWQGWATLALFIAAIVLDFLLLSGPIRWVIFVLLIVALWIVCVLKTEGGFRWRWGRDDEPPPRSRD